MKKKALNPKDLIAINHYMSGLSKAESLRLAGHSKNYQHNPSKFFNQQLVIDKMTPLVDKLEAIRDKLVASIAKDDPEQIAHKTKVESVDKMTKNIQLLKGKPTTITGNGEVGKLTDEELNKLAKKTARVLGGERDDPKLDQAVEAIVLDGEGEEETVKEERVKEPAISQAHTPDSPQPLDDVSHETH